MAACAILLGTDAEAACRVEQRGAVALDWSGGLPVVSARVDGRAAAFVLDTGAVRSVLAEAAVARLSLPLDDWAAMTLRGVGGGVRHRVARLRSLTLGGAALHRRSVAGDMSMAVAPALPFAGGRPVAGLLGGDYLRDYDLAWSGPEGRLGLYAVAGCYGRFLPWPGAYDAIPAQASPPGWLVVSVTVANRKLRALIDSGASHSLLTRSGAMRLGLRTNTGDRAALRGVGPAPVQARMATLAAMRVGSETISPARLLVGLDVVMPGIDLVLGTDWLAPRTVWLSYATGQVFVRPN